MRIDLALISISVAFITSSCQSERFKPEVSQQHAKAEAMQASDTEEDPAVQDHSDGDAIALPIPVTGAYLFCQELDADQNSLKRQIACRVEAGGTVIDDFESQVENIDWNQSNQGSSVTIRSVPVTDPSYWQKIFEIEAVPNAILSAVTIEVGFEFQGETLRIKTELAVVWDADCALPPIDFEALAGQNMTAGMAINDQFAASHGVRFATLSGAPVLLAAYGSNEAIAYYGGPDSTPNFLATHQNAGRFFITDGHKQADTTDTLVISYDRPTQSAALDLVDIDFSETYVVRALSAGGEVIDEVQIQSPVDNYRDGQMTRFIVSSPDPSNLIHTLHIHGFIPTGLSGIGFGLDNFAPRCAR